jgi:hypothetical protein
MPFGTGTVLTNKGKGILADRVRTSPGTYTASPKFVAHGNGATAAARTAAAADTALSVEQDLVASNRVTGSESTVTTTQTGDTYQVTGTVTAQAARNTTGANAPIDEAGLFDLITTGGNMFTSATFPVVNLASGDSIAYTWKVQIS